MWYVYEPDTTNLSTTTIQYPSYFDFTGNGVKNYYYYWSKELNKNFNVIETSAKILVSFFTYI